MPACQASLSQKLSLTMLIRSSFLMDALCQIAEPFILKGRKLAGLRCLFPLCGSPNKRADLCCLLAERLSAGGGSIATCSCFIVGSYPSHQQICSAWQDASIFLWWILECEQLCAADLLEFPF